MPDSKIDPFDIGALESAVNDSATRVSGLWLSFVAFSAYLAAAVSMISHRQIFLEDPIKLPTINIDLPLVASAILLPLLFVIYHVFVLLQVVLLARTADAYNQALEHNMAENDGRTLLRQRLANTLFAQLFAGSPREREGALGWLLRLMAWITIAIAPVLVLILFEIKFLPYHSPLITWTHRGLIVADLLAVLLLWAGAVQPRRDIALRSLLHDWKMLAGAALVALTACLVITYPGEHARTAMHHVSYDGYADPECWTPKFMSALFSSSLSVQGQDFVEDEKYEKIVAAAKANGQPAHKGPRTVLFRGRDLRCGNFSGADLRRTDFSEANLSGAVFKGAHLHGAVFSAARLRLTVFETAQLQGATFAEEEDEAKAPDQLLKAAEMPGASFRGAQLQGALLSGAQLKGATFDRAQAQGANFDRAELQGASFQGTRLDGATLKSAQLQGVIIVSTDADATDFSQAQLQAGSLGSSSFRGAEFDGAQLQGVKASGSRFEMANLSRVSLWQANELRCADAQVIKPDFRPLFAPAEVSASDEPAPRSRRRGRKAPTFDETIEQLVESMPASAASQLRTRFQQRLATDPSKPTTEEGQQKEWEECASKALDSDQFRLKRVPLFVKLVCDSDGNGKYIADNLSRNMYGMLGIAGARSYARALLGLDGKPCPGAKDLAESTKSELLKAVTD
jgi:uncharacterized protein YjbI with pentapeptide repeats